MSFFKNLKNRMRKVADEAAEAIKDDEANAQYAIEDAEDKIKEIRGNLAKVVSQRIQAERQVTAKQAEVDKYLNAAKAAKSKGDEANARSLLGEKQGRERELIALQAGLEEIKKGEAGMRTTLNTYETRVAKAKSNSAVLSARANTAKMRKELASATAGIEDNNVLSALDELEQDVLEDEAEAAAYEELGSASTSSEDLANQYLAEDTSSIDDEFAKL